MKYIIVTTAITRRQERDAMGYRCGGVYHQDIREGYMRVVIGLILEG